ncbi:hypothetical protein EAO69_25295 [Streptomyces sp. me109]|nr:hypothetical protein [Streptomyces sp. me109]TXS70161.1 hypothetical protein EAO69_25295 [Streptomyces sp. me109]
MDLLSSRFTYIGSSGMQMLCYLVPGAGGEREEGMRVSWVRYVNVPERDLLRLLEGRSEKRSCISGHLVNSGRRSLRSSRT